MIRLIVRETHLFSLWFISWHFRQLACSFVQPSFFQFACRSVGFNKAWEYEYLSRGKQMKSDWKNNITTCFPNSYTDNSSRSINWTLSTCPFLASCPFPSAETFCSRKEIFLACSIKPFLSAYFLLESLQETLIYVHVSQVVKKVNYYQ